MFIPVKKLVDLNTQIFCAGYDRDCVVSDMEGWLLVVKFYQLQEQKVSEASEVYLIQKSPKNTSKSSHPIRRRYFDSSCCHIKKVDIA